MARRQNRWLGWGLFFGAAAGLVWTWRRAGEMAGKRPPGLLDWERVRTVAGRFCQDEAPAVRREAYYAGLVARSIEEVSRYTGLELPSDRLAVRVLGRRQWLTTNLETFRSILQPLEELYERVSSSPGVISLLLGNPVRSFVSHQVGLLLGYLAQRVLGQYDIALLGREPLQDGQLFFVEPNIRGTQVQLGLPGNDFPMWVALHETTHAFEFEVHPWVRGHFNGLLQAYLAELEPEIDHLSQQLSLAGIVDLFGRIRQGESWLLWALTPRQRVLFDQMQSFMCIVEGYSNYVMNRVGHGILPTFDLIEERIAARRKQRTSAERLLGRLTGLDLKMEQYSRGEQFVEAVVRQRDLSFLHRIWQRAENLPTMEEIARPERWIARMGGEDVEAGR